MNLALDEVLVIVQVAVVGGNAVIVAHILAAHPLFLGHQGLVQLFAVAGADDVRACIAEQGLHGFGQVADGGSVALLDEEVAGVGMLKRKHDQIDGFVEVHQETGHVGVGDSDGVACLDLVDEQRDNGTAAAHNVAVTGAADGRSCLFTQRTALGYGNLLHHGLADAHGIDGIGSLVGRKHYYILYTMRYGGFQYIVGTDHIGLHSLQRKELATGNLLQGGGGKHIIHSHHGTVHRLAVTDITNVKFHFRILQVMTHVILLFLVTAKDANFLDI